MTDSQRNRTYWSEKSSVSASQPLRLTVDVGLLYCFLAEEEVADCLKLQNLSISVAGSDCIIIY